MLSPASRQALQLQPLPAAARSQLIPWDAQQTSHDCCCERSTVPSQGTATEWDRIAASSHLQGSLMPLREDTAKADKQPWANTALPSLQKQHDISFAHNPCSVGQTHLQEESQRHCRTSSAAGPSASALQVQPLRERWSAGQGEERRDEAAQSAGLAD